MNTQNETTTTTNDIQYRIAFLREIIIPEIEADLKVTLCNEELIAEMAAQYKVTGLDKCAGTRAVNILHSTMRQCIRQAKLEIAELSGKLYDAGM